MRIKTINILSDVLGEIWIWNLTKNQSTILQEDPDQVAIRSLDITIDGSKLVAANSEGMMFTRIAYDDSEFLPQEEIEAHPGSYILKCKFSRWGQFIATCSSDRTVKIWEWDDDWNFDETQELAGHLGWVWDCAFTANSDYLLTVSTDTVIRIWDVATGDLKRPLKGHTKGITSLAFSDM